MARSKVTLSGSAQSYTRSGRIFRRGKPQFLTAPGEIAFYRTCAGFSVVDVESKEKAKAKAPKVEKTAKKAAKKTSKKSGKKATKKKAATK